MEISDLVKLANDRMTITQALAEIGAEVSLYGTTTKTYCPFGHLYHSDMGASKAMRVYPDTNSAWCFAGCGFFSPVRVISLDKDLTEEAAANYILDVTGYVPDDYMSRWEALTKEKETVDTDSLAEALKVACSRMHPRWEEIQFDEAVSGKLAQCLSLLRQVRSAGDAEKWLRMTKEAMRLKLKEVP